MRVRTMTQALAVALAGALSLTACDFKVENPGPHKQRRNLRSPLPVVTPRVLPNWSHPGHAHFLSCHFADFMVRHSGT